VERAAQGGFVVQELVPTPARAVQVCGPTESCRRASLLDYSAFLSVGLDVPAWSGACRASSAPPPQRLERAAMVPLLRAEVARGLLE